MMGEMLDEINRYYSEKVQTHGATSRGVDWNGKDSHYLRFDQLSKLLIDKSDFTLLDYGCGFGSLVDYLRSNTIDCEYTGYDISMEMINKAKTIYSAQNIQFVNELSPNKKYDYTIANGIFNVKLDASEQDWKQYVLDTITDMDKRSNKGFSFNVLTSYSDKEYKKDYLHYASPTALFDFCKGISRNVALLHDYELYEFTIIVRK